MAIDIFFRHLAEGQDGKAVGIVLPGMGSDGTLGIRALEEQMGMAMAQEPSTARFGSMPQSAIATGLIDHIASPEDLLQSLIDYIRTRSLLQGHTHAAAREWTQDRRHHCIRSIVNREICLEAVVEDNISKPVQVKELLAILKKYSSLEGPV